MTAESSIYSAKPTINVEVHAGDMPPSLLLLLAIFSLASLGYSPSQIVLGWDEVVDTALMDERFDALAGYKLHGMGLIRMSRGLENDHQCCYAGIGELDAG